MTKPPPAHPEPVEGRTFGLNSREFHEAVREPPDPMVMRGGLPREPRMRDQVVIVERSVKRRSG